MDCFCRLSAESPPPGLSAVVDPLDCLVIHCVVLAAWDDQADVDDPEEDLTCSRPVELEVLDQAWDGPVDQAAAVCQVVEVHPLIGLIAGASENN